MHPEKRLYPTTRPKATKEATMKETIEFVKCTESKEPQLKYWAQYSFIYFKCQCGEYFSYDTPNREKHLIRYAITKNRKRGEKYKV